MSIGVNHWVMGDASPKKFLVGGMAILPSPIRMVNWTAVQPQHNQIAPAYSESIGLVTVDSTSSSFTSISNFPLDLLGLRLGLHWGVTSVPRIPSPLRQSIPQSYRAVDATAHVLRMQTNSYETCFCGGLYYFRL